MGKVGLEHEGFGRVGVTHIQLVPVLSNPAAMAIDPGMRRMTRPLDDESSATPLTHLTKHLPKSTVWKTT